MDNELMTYPNNPVLTGEEANELIQQFYDKEIILKELSAKAIISKNASDKAKEKVEELQKAANLAEEKARKEMKDELKEEIMEELSSKE